MEAARALAGQQLGFVSMFVLPMLDKVTEAGVAPKTVSMFRRGVLQNREYWTARKVMNELPADESS